jgi:hypothetical protein
VDFRSKVRKKQKKNVGYLTFIGKVINFWVIHYIGVNHFCLQHGLNKVPKDADFT